MLHRHRHGGPGNASPVSTPTTKSSNCPNSHRGQHLCTHSGFRFSPSPFQFPPQEVTTWTLEEHPMEEHSHLTPVSAPMSRTSPTNSGEILQQLVQALTLLGQAPPVSTPPAPSSSPATHIRSPDAFDGSNPDDL